MNTVERKEEAQEAFAVWITGLPASGKSTLAAALKAQLAARGVAVAVLESDVLRRIFTVHPRYDEAERDVFYRQVAYVGELLVEHGVPVIFDATANRRLYRDRARHEIPRLPPAWPGIRKAFTAKLWGKSRPMYPACSLPMSRRRLRK